MPKFGRQSKKRLETCHLDLQRVLHVVIEYYDFTVLVGYRSPERQKILYDAGRSKVQTSKHNENPSLAVDIAPWPIRWADFPYGSLEQIQSIEDLRRDCEAWARDLGRFYFLAGRIMTLAESQGVKLRWGGDWDGDGDFRDQTLQDLVHFEIKGKI